MSKTVLAFAEPILGDEHDRPELRSAAMKIVETVWNASVLEECRGERGFVDQIRARLVGHPEAALVEMLLERKRRDFGEHRC